MKFSKSILILSTAGLGLTLAYSQQANSDAQQKALEILHQQLAGQNTAAPAAAPAAAKPVAGTPTREQLLADVERLHTEQKISDQQYEAFKKNINDQYAASASTSQTQALTQQALAQKIQQLKTGPVAATAAQPVVTQTAPKSQSTAAPAAIAASNAEAQAKAQKALEAQLAQERANQAAKAPPPAEAKPPVKAAKAPAPKPAPAPAVAAAPARTVERTNVVPATAYSTLSAQQEAQAREALRQKIAEANSQTPQPKPATKAAAVAEAPVVAAPTRKPAPAPAPAPVVAAAVAAPASGFGGPPAAVAVLREYEIGIPPGTPELVRILRVKEAELDGTITPQQAAQIPLPTKFYGPSPWAVAATSPKTEIPVATSNKEGLERLSELNYRYRANLISPAEYQAQRAKIVTGL